MVVRSHLTGSLVIEVKRDDKYPLEKQFVKQARDYADDIGAEFFATCTSNDFFLFDYNGELALTDVEFYYLDLREADPHDPTFGGVIPKILQAVQYLSEKGVLPNQRERDRITGLLRSFHTAIWPTYYALAEATYEKNAAFTNNFDEWVAENDYTGLSLDEQLELAAKQHAYLLTNKILFYEVVREKTPEPIGTQSGFKLDSLHEGVTVESIDTHVRRQFGRIVEEIDYEPIFNDGSSLFASFPENKRTQHAVNDLLQSIEAQAVTDLDEDLLGELYEELIPEDERKALGQFYTPPKIAEAIVQWAITPQSDGSIPQVLDPASGSGTFSVEAYKRIAELCPAAGHQEIVDHILAVDVNKFPLHLTALNLASRNITERTDRLHARNDSFFDIDPNSRTLSTYGNGGFDGAVTGRYDAAVANPPYIRQENLYPNKEHFRHHLKNYRVNDATPYYDGKKKLSKKSDAYIYFVTYALQFLREGGRLGFIIPAKWLDVQYGEPFQQFLFDNTKIHAVVDFSARAFEDALVNTALLLVEKCSDERERNANVTDFIRVREAMSPTDLVDTVEFQRTVPDDRSLEFEKREGYSIVSVDQSDLNEQGPRKLGYYLYAPRPIIDLLESDLFVPLA
ncbi:MAG: N-6 DNA methylase [Euryarchaeota archaeon]|nr:N-6 DNA methylase [Euryarchaeota archaeon]